MWRLLDQFYSQKRELLGLCMCAWDKRRNVVMYSSSCAHLSTQKYISCSTCLGLVASSSPATLLVRWLLVLPTLATSPLYLFHYSAPGHFSPPLCVKMTIFSSSVRSADGIVSIRNGSPATSTTFPSTSNHLGSILDPLFRNFLPSLWKWLATANTLVGVLLQVWCQV